MAAPTFVVSALAPFTTQQAAGNATATTSAALSVLAGDIIAVVSAGEDAVEVGAIGISDSGGNAYTERAQSTTTNRCSVDATTATASAVASLTGTTTRGATASARYFGSAYTAWRGSDGVGPNTLNTAAQSGSITTTQDNSAILLIIGDWSATTGARTWVQVNGAAPTEITAGQQGSAYGWAVAYYADAGTAGAKTVGLSAPTLSTPNIIAIEIKGSAGLTITEHPHSQQVPAGSTPQFSVIAPGATSYQWQDNQGGTFADISGATSSTYTTPALAAGVAYAVRVIVDGTVTSNPADVWTPVAKPLPWAGLYGSGKRNTSVTQWPSSRTADDILIDAIFGATTASGGSGELAKTLDALTASASGALAITGQLSATLGDVASAGTGQLPVSGAGAGQLGALTMAAAGSLTLTGQLAATLGQLTLSSSGTLAEPAITGTLAVTLDPITTAGTGQLSVAGAGAGQLGSLTASATGTLAIAAQLASTLDGVVLSAAGLLVAGGTGQLGGTLDDVTMVATGELGEAEGDAGTKGNGGSLFRRRLVHPYPTETARKAAKRKLPHIPAAERDAISRAARTLVAMPNFTEATVDAVLAQAMPPGIEPIELHVHWLLYLLRIQAYRQAQEQDDEDVILLLA